MLLKKISRYFESLFGIGFNQQYLYFLCIEIKGSILRKPRQQDLIFLEKIDTLSLSFYIYIMKDENDEMER